MLNAMPAELRGLLSQVSRTFYLTLCVLPREIRPQIELAYLLARATDTIADTPLVPIERRQQALQCLRNSILTAADGHQAPLPEFGELAAALERSAGQGSFAERTLLGSIGKALKALRALSPGDRRRIRDVLDTITNGQEMDLNRFGAASAGQIAALETGAELDDYIYRVAGCVGEFWTKMCRAHLFPQARLDDEVLVTRGIRFGKGLQLVNILRDLPKDLRQGRCYIPAEQLQEHGLGPEALLDPASMYRFRALYDSYLQHAEEHLAAGWAYTNALPFDQPRVRLSCAWPILIGIKTLACLRAGNVLEPHDRVKISRSEIRQVMARSVLYYPIPALWSRLFDGMQ